MCSKFVEENYDVVVVGAGHAGCAGVLADQRFAKNPSMEFVFRTSIFFMFL